MFRRDRLRLISVIALFLIAAAACGQKPGIAEKGTAAGLSSGNEIQLPEGTELDEQGNLVDSETGAIIATADELAETNPGLAGGTTDDTGSTDPGDTGTTDPDDPGTGDDGPGEGDAAPGDATGVSEDTIKIGIHAPITGAAPVPSQSFQKGKDLYWNWLRSNKESIFGRDVEVVFRNDNYNPSQAVSACREMVEQEKVFLLMGVAGTDQIQACAKYAASVGVPYLSAGVTQIGLEGLRNYFALWRSYPEQGPLLADLLVSQLGAKDEKNGMLRFNTPTFQDGHDAFIEGMEDAGADVVYDRAISKTASASDAQTIATELNQQGIENVHVLVSPTFFIQLAQAAQNQQYHPQWVGYGLTMGLDTVANVACKNQSSIQNGRFLSPFPAYVDSNKFDPNFRKAGGTDDIMFALWASSKVIAEMLKKGGEDLTRESFILNNEKGGTIKTGVNPDVSFTANDHFGGTSMHLLRADCPNNRYVTEKSFVTNF